MEKIKVLLADDHTVVRQGLRVLLEAEPELPSLARLPMGAKRCN